MSDDVRHPGDEPDDSGDSPATPPAGETPTPRETPQDDPTTRAQGGGMGFRSPGAPGGMPGGLPGDLTGALGGMPGGGFGGLGGGLGGIEEILGQLASGGGDPRLQEALRSMGVDLGNPAVMGQLQQQMQAMFGGGQSDDDRAAAATDIARKTVAATGEDRTVGEAARRAVEDAVRIAELWVDPVTAFGAPTGTGKAWSRAEWVEATMPTWRALVSPVNDGVTRAVADALGGQLDALGELGDVDLGSLDPQDLERMGLSGLSEQLGALGAGGAGQNPLAGLDLGAMMQQLRPMMENLARGFFTAQTGHAVGALSEDLLSATEVGLPLLRTEDVALLPAQVATFAQGLSLDETEVRMYLATREAARVRLFAEVPWLGPQLEAAVRDYAAAIAIDTDAIEERVRDVDPSNLEAMQAAMADMQVFSTKPSPVQQRALERLETSLALVEGWVDLVTEQATEGKLPHAAALGEAMRRRRASGGPAERTFSSLVGLQLRPRRLKDARNLWAALEDAGGLAFRDAPWSHPDVAPTTADLDDPLGYVERRKAGPQRDTMDDELDRLLAGVDTHDGAGEDPKPGPAAGPGAEGQSGPGPAGQSGPGADPQA